MPVRIEVENYRVLKKVDWELPKGVCPLVGPNGSGKTTLLRCFRFLRKVLSNGVDEAVIRDGGIDDLARLDADANALVRMTLTLENLRWQVEILADRRRRRLSSGETVAVDGQQVAARKLGDETMSFGAKSAPANAGFRQFSHESFPSDDPTKGPFRRPVSILTDYRLYEPIAFETVRAGSKLSPWRVLLESGQNLFAVLRNWNDRRDSRRKLAFVKDTLADAFPDIFEDMDFDFEKDIVTGLLHLPGGARPLPMSAAPTGLLSLLYLLCAVISTERGGVVALDEPENALHPFAIQKFVDAARQWAAQEDLTVLLATHSPVLLDRFKEEPEQIFVMDPTKEPLPIRLSEMHDPEWLAQFSLGDLYKFGDFGAPVPAGAAS